jgi:hypothetical protein
MKKFFFVIVLFAASFSLNAQNEYFQHDPAWTVLQIHSQFYPCVSYDTTTFYLSGDSIYNSFTYKKVWAKGSVHKQWWSPNPNFNCYNDYTYVDTVPCGLIRSSGTQMFFILPSLTNEQIIYDFNMTIGSHPPYSGLTTSDTTITVTSIDSVYTPYGYRKRFYFDNSSDYIIEGVGSHRGLYQYFGVMLDYTSQFMCYSLNDTTWIPQPGPSCEAIITSVQSPTISAPEVNVYPNPASDQLTISAPQMNGTLIISNALGRTVYSDQFSGQTTIPVSDLAPGIYLARISDEKQVVTREFVVQ